MPTLNEGLDTFFQGKYFMSLCGEIYQPHNIKTDSAGEIFLCTEVFNVEGDRLRAESKLLALCLTDTLAPEDWRPNTFNAHLNYCTKVVSKWPKWKQNLLGRLA